ncbi:hypothetical protein KGF54_001686 [Candida jiufengensis]|uniref:uncharacterized protein n=1 Tax=Candida jiufengensis TaxID=497108 RepID=UPI002224DBF5|nr:uncharacterized protein KGF54_001686 [Candida jiufengensis]KAI5955125.1 hypothetical protein KGF54_001686 [Candida jiufengensis]
MPLNKLINITSSTTTQPSLDSINENSKEPIDKNWNNCDYEIKEQDRFLPIANGTVMKKALPSHAKLSKESKECIQECVSEFISFITSQSSDKCKLEKRKTLNGEDILWSLYCLGFENYSETLKIYLAKYRQQEQAMIKPPRKKPKRSRKIKQETIEEEEDEDEETDQQLILGQVDSYEQDEEFDEEEEDEIDEIDEENNSDNNQLLSNEYIDANYLQQPQLPQIIPNNELQNDPEYQQYIQNQLNLQQQQNQQNLQQLQNFQNHQNSYVPNQPIQPNFPILHQQPAQIQQQQQYIQPLQQHFNQSNIVTPPTTNDVEITQIGTNIEFILKSSPSSNFTK